MLFLWKFTRKTSYLLCFVFGCKYIAQAESLPVGTPQPKTVLALEAVNAPKNPSAENVSNLEVKPYAFIENYLILSRSSNSKVPAFESGRWYLGLKAKKGISNASVETFLTGPSSFITHEHKAAVKIGDDSVAGVVTPKASMLEGLIGIRKAEVGLDFNHIKINLGRIRPSGAKMAGADSVGWFAGADSLGSVDGIMIRVPLLVPLSENNKLASEWLLVSANQMDNRFGGTVSASFKERFYSPYGYTGLAKGFAKKERAWIGALKANLLGVQFIAYEGYEAKQILKLIPDSFAACANANHREYSVIYEGIKNIRTGVWWQQNVLSKIETCQIDPKSGEMKIVDRYIDSSIANTGKYIRNKIGAGFEIESEALGIKDIFTERDNFKLGLSYEYNDQGRTQNAPENFKVLEESKATDIYTASLGYMTGGTETYLGAKYERSKGNKLKLFDGSEGKEQLITYVKMSWWFE